MKTKFPNAMYKNSQKYIIEFIWRENGYKLLYYLNQLYFCFLYINT